MNGSPYMSPTPVNKPDACEPSTWADGPWSYRAAVLDGATGLYEAYLGSCANHGIVTEGGVIEYRPCFVNINGGTYNTTEVRSPASPNDPRVSH